MTKYDAEETLNKYLINVLNIKIPWGGIKSFKEKDHERRELHNKLVQELNIKDREIISKCADAAYANYLKYQKLEKATAAFIHEFNVITGKNPLTPAQESNILKFCDQLGTTHTKYDRISKVYYKYCDSVRKKIYENKILEWREKLKTKTPEELLNMLKAIPEKYKQLYDRFGLRSSEWHHWVDTLDYEPGNGFGCIYYRMEAYFWAQWFYHDYYKNICIIENKIKKWNASQDQIDYAIRCLAYLYMRFDGVEEYLSTPWEKLVEIFMSFDNNEEINNDK